MSERIYKIRNTVTGLFFSNWQWTNSPGSSDDILLIPIFDDEGENMNTRYLYSVVETAVSLNIPDFFDNAEIIAFEYVRVKTTMKIASVKRRVEAKVIMDRLKQ